jgi:hypothetical protein
MGTSVSPWRWGAAQARLRIELSDAAEAAAQAASAAQAREAGAYSSLLSST